jgi:large subunit ribosomal protein L18
LVALIKKPDRKLLRAKRHLRVRKKISGTAERPRLNVFRSLKHIYAQIIDDDRGVTLVSASTLSPELRGQLKSGSNKEAAAAVGRLVAQKALERGIKKVVFDRGGYIYHGRVKALAEAAREAGLEF